MCIAGLNSRASYATGSHRAIKIFLSCAFSRRRYKKWIIYMVCMLDTVLWHCINFSSVYYGDHPKMFCPPARDTVLLSIILFTRLKFLEKNASQEEIPKNSFWTLMTRLSDFFYLKIYTKFTSEARINYHLIAIESK